MENGIELEIINKFADELNYWKRENGVWKSGLYTIKPRFRFFKLFLNGRFVDNFQSLQAAKDAALN